MSRRHIPALRAEVQRQGAGYVRLSKEAGDTNMSKDGMVKDLHAKAAEDGVELVTVLIDDGLSGSIRDRPEFQDWLDLARRGEVGNLYAWHTDRITREGMNAAALLLDVLEGKDPTTGKQVRPEVRFADCKGLDSAGGPDAQFAFRVRFLLVAEMARAERMRIVDRNTATQQRLRESLRFRGGTPPYGYTVVPHDSGKGKGLAVDPVAARFIEEAAQFILDGGTLYGAVKLLNDKGSKPPRAKAWSMPSLRQVLIGDSVLGRITHQGEPIRDEDGMPVAPWPPILGLVEVERLRALLAASGKGPGTQRRRRAARLLSGIIVCGNCGSKLKANISHKWVRYVCPGRAQGRGCTRVVTINADLAEKHIEQEFLRGVGGAAYMKPAPRVQEAAGLAEIEAALKDLTAKMAQPGANVAELYEQIVGLHAKRDAIQEATPEPTVEMIDTGKTWGEVWTEADVRTRRDYLRDLLDDVIRVGPGVPGDKRFDPGRLGQIPWNEKYRKIANLPAQAR